MTSPKINRTSTGATAAVAPAKLPEKSPVLKVRKNNTINAALKASQNNSGHTIVDAAKPVRNLPPIHRATPSPPQQHQQHQQQQQLPQQQQSAPENSPAQLVAHTPPPPSLHADDAHSLSSDDDSDHINVDKLKTIHNKVAQKSQQYHSKNKSPAPNASVFDDTNAELSATMIQKMWRGYKIRKDNKDIAETLQKKRTQEYLVYVYIFMLGQKPFDRQI